MPKSLPSTRPKPHLKNTIATSLALLALALAIALPACKKNDDAKKKDEHTDHSH